MDDAISPEMRYEPDLADAMDQQLPTSDEMPEMPTKVEAECWVLATCEGKRQDEIASLKQMTQGAVSKAVTRATAKIAALVDGRWIDREYFEARLRRIVGLAPRT